MLGKEFLKSNYDLEEYALCAKWCNENNCHIEEQGNKYVVVENEVIPPAPIDNTPTLEQRINDIELALMELAGEL